MKKIWIVLLTLIAYSVQAAQIETKFIQDSAITKIKIASNAVGTTAIQLENNAPFRALGVASIDTPLFKFDNSNLFQFIQWPYTPQSMPFLNYQVANKAYVDQQVGAIIQGKTNWEELLALSSGDITNQYKDASQNCDPNSVEVSVTGVWGIRTLDYTLSVVANKTRISFVASTGYGTDSSQALGSSDSIYLHCQY